MNSNIDIIAEIGVNHDGNVEIAKELIFAASESGATKVKLQIFQPHLLASGQAELAQYQIMNGVTLKSQIEMLDSLTLSQDEIRQLDILAKKLNLELIATPFDLRSMRFIKEDLMHDTVKIGSGDLTFHQLIYEASKSGLNLIISTGMAFEEEVRNAVLIARAGRAVYEGYLPIDFKPTKQNLKRVNLDWFTDASNWLTLLHCTSSYPAKHNQLNISAIKVLSKMNTTLGYSDHSLTSHGAILAMALGAKVFEKHLTYSQEALGPDHAASLDPNQFQIYVQDLLISAQALGDERKAPQLDELNVRGVARRGLYAAEDISFGENYSEQNMVCLRPNKGYSSADFFEVLNTPCKAEIKRGSPIGN